MDKDFINMLLGDDIDPTLALPDPSLMQYYHDLKNRTIWIDEEIDGMTLDVVSKSFDGIKKIKIFQLKSENQLEFYSVALAVV